MSARKTKVLVVRFSSLGDIILMTPLLRALREGMPGSEIHVVTKARYVDVFSGNKRIDRVHLLHDGGILELLGLAARLGSERYDVVIDAHNVLRSRLLVGLLSARKKPRIGKDHVKKLCLIRRKINLYDRIAPQSQRYLDLARRLGIEPGCLPTELAVPAAADERIRELIVESGLAWKPIVSAAPGAHWKTKAWPPEHWIDLIASLTDRGIGTILVGGVGEKALGAHIAARCPGTLDLTGSLGILETAAVLKRSDCLVTNDSAPLHIAEAVGTPVVAIFGPTVREFGYFPHLARSTVVEIDLECRPCSRNGSKPCPLGTNECLSSIPPARVLSAALEIVRVDRAETQPSESGERSR